MTFPGTQQISIILEVIPSNTKNSLESIGGPESALAKKHKLFLHFTGVIDMPEDYE
jgi:hypothetical protein